MDNSKLYLLKKIVGYKENGLSSLGELHAKHVDDISIIMKQFFEDSMKEFIERVNDGKSVDVGFGLIKLVKRKRN